MTLSESIKTRLGESEFLSRQVSMLDEFGAMPEVKASVLDYARQKTASIRELADALSSQDDEPELYRSIGYLWLELKSEWVRYNQTMQYQVARDGQADPVVFTKGSVCADVLCAIEDLLMPHDLETLGSISVEPLNAVKAGAESVQKFLAHYEQQIGLIARIFASATGALEGVTNFRAAMPGAPTELDKLSARYQKMLNDLARESDAVLKVDLELVWPVVAEAIESCAMGLNQRVQPVRVQTSASKVDLRITRTLGVMTRTAAAMLLGHATPAAAREAAGKAPHTTLTVEVSSDLSGTELRLRDDGDGTLKARGAADESVAAAWQGMLEELASHGATAKLLDEPGVGSAIEVRLSHSGLASGESFLVISAGSTQICVPASQANEQRKIGKDDEVLDLRTDPSSSRSMVPVTLPSGRHVVLVGSGPTLTVQAIAVPSMAVEGADADVFALSVLTPKGVAGLLDERAFHALSAAVAQAAQ